MNSRKIKETERVAHMGKKITEKNKCPNVTIA
jgi:hypothetical protein